MTEVEKKIIRDLRLQARKESQKCYNPGCNKLAIRSHIQQAEGPLREIADNGFVMQLQTRPFFLEQRYSFIKEHIKNEKGSVLTFWGFCNSCDSKLFKPIEQKTYDFYDYKNQLLHAYRGFLSEHYKQEYNLKHYKLIFGDKKISKQTKNNWQHTNLKFQISVCFGKYFKQLFEKDINKKKLWFLSKANNFEFITLKLPRIEICTSTVFAYPYEANVSKDLKEKIENGLPIKPQGAIISISLVPHGQYTYCILGQPLESYINKLQFNEISKFTTEESLNLVNGILIKNIETWCMSLAFYDDLRKTGKDKKLLLEIHKHLPADKKRSTVKFNVFEEST
ncbi:MAG: hypothetical protein V4580_14420 [Bacteroidota bacterium]